MKFAKLSDISTVDFSLPPDAPGNAAVLARSSSNPSSLQSFNSPILYVGGTGWGVKEWVGKIYPKGTKTPNFLHHYTHQFNTIELNTTHYRIPDALTVQHWHDEAAADFRFCPKVPQVISHAGDLGVNGELIQRFCEAVSGLGSKLGPCFVQLPPYFGVERVGALEAFLKVFSLPLAVEVRHESWFDSAASLRKLTDLLERYGASTVITDVAGRRDVAHMALTSDKVLVRFVGNALHPTDFTRLDSWVARLGDWFSKGLRECYFFTHEPDDVLVPELAVALVERAKGIEGLSTRGPKIIGENTEGQQMTLF